MLNANWYSLVLNNTMRVGASSGLYISIAASGVPGSTTTWSYTMSHGYVVRNNANPNAGLPFQIQLNQYSGALLVEGNQNLTEFDYYSGGSSRAVYRRNVVAPYLRKATPSMTCNNVACGAAYPTNATLAFADCVKKCGALFAEFA